MTASYLYNWNPSPLLQDKSSLEALFLRTPEYSKLRVFGCRCYPCLRPYRKNKLEVKSRPCIFVGYASQQDGYLCLEPTSRRIFSSRDVTFDENDFSLSSLFFREAIRDKDRSALRNISIGLPVIQTDIIGDRRGTEEADSNNQRIRKTVPDSSSNVDPTTDTQISGEPPRSSLAVLQSLFD